MRKLRCVFPLISVLVSLATGTAARALEKCPDVHVHSTMDFLGMDDCLRLSSASKEVMRKTKSSRVWKKKCKELWTSQFKSLPEAEQKRTGDEEWGWREIFLLLSKLDRLENRAKIEGAFLDREWGLLRRMANEEFWCKRELQDIRFHYQREIEKAGFDRLGIESLDESSGLRKVLSSATHSAAHFCLRSVESATPLLGIPTCLSLAGGTLSLIAVPLYPRILIYGTAPCMGAFVGLIATGVGLSRLTEYLGTELQLSENRSKKMALANFEKRIPQILEEFKERYGEVPLLACILHTQTPENPGQDPP